MIDKEALLRTCEPTIRRMAYHFTGILEHEDLVSESILAILEYLEKGSITDVPFLIRVAQRQMIDLVRREQRHALPTVSLDLTEAYGEEQQALCETLAAPDPQANPEAAQKYHALYLALERLTMRQRNALMRRYGLRECGVSSLLEMAQEEGVKACAIKDRIHLGLLALRKRPEILAEVSV